MSEKDSFGIVGGDKRQIALAESLAGMAIGCMYMGLIWPGRFTERSRRTGRRDSIRAARSFCRSR